ncbi:hypothetical protein ACU81Q_13575 [Komagataeibacter melomenusus]
MVKVGDVFYINTTKGRGYFQYVKHYPRFSYLIRVFEGIYPDEDQNIAGIVHSPVAFLIFFPLGAADRRKLVHKCGHVPLDEEGQKIPVFRNGVPDPQTNRVEVWCFSDEEKEWFVENITDEQRKLPLKIIANAASLIYKIDNGWRPENHPW